MTTLSSDAETSQTAPQQIIPVLIGADLNCYHLARAFHEAYGVCSYAFGRYPIGVTMHSKLIHFQQVQHLDTDEVFLQTMQDFAKAHAADNSSLILMGCTDDYVNLIARHKETLVQNYIVPYNDISLMNAFASKARFYQSCEKHGISYPKTVIVPQKQVPSLEALQPQALGFSYPIIVKPANSIVYWKHPFPQMHKVYTAQTPQEAQQLVKTIVSSGYDDTIILQDMIPGRDSHMYVLTAYCNQNAKVTMMCLGHVLLEEHTPKGRGNHAAIITEYHLPLMEQFKRFLEDIHYVGFANFDIKYDTRDNTYRAFEINLRQGRSNYYVTAAGQNVAKLVVDDYVFHKENTQTVFVNQEMLWTCLPLGVVYKYTDDHALVQRAKQLVHEHKYVDSLRYKEDLRGNLKRTAYIWAHEMKHYQKYKKYPE